jgi:hypothetical protein
MIYFTFTPKSGSPLFVHTYHTLLYILIRHFFSTPISGTPFSTPVSESPLYDVSTPVAGSPSALHPYLAGPYRLFELKSIFKSYVSWDITPYISLKFSWSFGGAFCLHLQGWRANQAKKQHEAGSKFRVVFCFAWSSTLKVEVTFSFEVSVDF